MAACRLIVHADDFGISRRANEGIIEAHRRGIVTSTSIMASGEAFEHALDLLETTASLDVGVHLTLVDELPVLPGSEVSSLVGRDGRFHDGAAAFMKRYLRGAVSLAEVERELDAQITGVLNRGVKVSHLDSHQHLHVLPGVRRIVGQLAAKNGIRAIRHPLERPSPYMLGHPGATNRLAQLAILSAFCATARTAGTRQPDRFFGFFFGGKLTKANLMTVLRALPPCGICELMCHPGLVDPLSRHARWGYRWQDELDALTDRDVKEYVRAADIALVSYAVLTG
jgi:chitin disaccharide deacetylase